MRRVDIQRVKNIEACINTAERNIASYEVMKTAKEIQIASYDGDIREPAKYITGEMKNRIIDMLIEEQQKFMDKQLAELEKI